MTTRHRNEGDNATRNIFCNPPAGLRLYAHTHRLTHRRTHRQAHRHIQTHRQTQTQTHTSARTHRPAQTCRQTHRLTHTHTHTHNENHKNTSKAPGKHKQKQKTAVGEKPRSCRGAVNIFRSGKKNRHSERRTRMTYTLKDAGSSSTPPLA